MSGGHGDDLRFLGLIEHEQQALPVAAAQGHLNAGRRRDEGNHAGGVEGIAQQGIVERRFREHRADIVRPSSSE